jgi:hypothetical protein
MAHKELELANAKNKYHTCILLFNIFLTIYKNDIKG